MSRASQKKDLLEGLIGYPLMTPKQVATFLSCSADNVLRMIERGVLPGADVGLGSKRHTYRIDPTDAAVFLLAARERITAGEFWDKHGPEGTPEQCKRLLTRIRKIQAAA